MKALNKLLLACALTGSLLACGDDDDKNTGALDASTPAPTLDATVPSIDSALPDAAVVVTPPAVDPLYMVSTSVTTTDESTLLMMTGKALDNASLDPKKALQFPGGGGVAVYKGVYYVAEAEKQTITRYTYENDAFVKGPTLSFLGQGIEYISAYFEVAANDDTRAFIIDGPLMKIFEWNPTTMTLTTTHDISGFKKEGWGQEFRGSFMRASDGKIFIYWTYTNDRKDFINEFTVGVFDTRTNTLKILTDTSCPASAGFGGYFDEGENLYLIADSFGLFTKFGGFKDAKEACVLRINKGQDVFDPSYKLIPRDSMGGKEPWGWYYAGDGIAYTTAVDPAKIDDYASVFELIFAPIHSSFLVDTQKKSSIELKDIPPTGVGFESQRVDGKLLVPRSTGTVKIFDVEASQSTVYDIRKDGSATPLFSLPGDVNEIVRIR